MNITRRESIKVIGAAGVGTLTPLALAQNDTMPPTPPRMPLHEFVKDADLMNALRRGVRAMKKRKPSDPLSWFYQAAIHGFTNDMVKIEEVNDPEVKNVDQKKYWSQCPHFGQSAANFLPWHRAYTHYFERILRAHTGEPRFALPYWDYSLPENYKFPREFGISKLDAPLDGDETNPLFHDIRNIYFTSYEHWSGTNLPYTQLTPEAVDWTPARESKAFFGLDERDGLGGGIGDDDMSTRGRLESFPHDPIHRLTGGVVPRPPLPNPDDPANPIEQDAVSGGMASPPTAGFDPIFCVHHSNIDRLWAEWSCMPGKEWGHFPPTDWFEEKAWFFFDVVVEHGVLKAVEVNLPRKAFFDYRALGISFKYEDLTKKPLILPDQIPPSPPFAFGPQQLLARIDSMQRVSGLLPERVELASAAKELDTAFFTAKSLTPTNALQKRLQMRITGVDLGLANSTGFDVHLVTKQGGNPNRGEPSFLGSIALFRHDGHAHVAHDHGGEGAKSKVPSDTFDITDVLRAANETDPTRMFVVIVPYSLSSGIGGEKAVIETSALRFDGIEFWSK